MEGDIRLLHICGRAYTFLSTPSGWRATRRASTSNPKCRFLSTPSGWRATRKDYDPIRGRDNFYPRPPGGGRHPARDDRRSKQIISIHALRVEGDAKGQDHHPHRSDFYPRPPGGGRHTRKTRINSIYFISIHALRVEGDFNVVTVNGGDMIFLSTPSGWRATQGGKRPVLTLLDFYPRPPGGGRPV